MKVVHSDGLAPNFGGKHSIDPDDITSEVVIVSQTYLPFLYFGRFVHAVIVLSH